MGPVYIVCFQLFLFIRFVKLGTWQHGPLGLPSLLQLGIHVLYSRTEVLYIYTKIVQCTRTYVSPTYCIG